ncbi:MAG TPA: phosphoadenylyl-sulfate reductase [Burkholderiales bacterium]|nr:phosphoadenylyl-sulfate reductase [Burkholderiales bacterium]
MDLPAVGTKVDEARRLLEEARKLAPAVFTSSLGAEDMVLFDLIARDFREIEIATLDTGRLCPETYDLMDEAATHYRRKVKIYSPRHEGVESFVRINGINGFYESISQRKDCCEVRKLEPLKRALAGKRAWVTGMRRDQSVTRQALEPAAYDETQGLYKFSPLADWSQEDVWNYIRSNNVPYNALHDRGYPSIGCAPCTRAVAPGEDVRAGRWWWESAMSKECGLHPQGVKA